MKPTPIKFRFATQDCETWFDYVAVHVVSAFDWASIKDVGVRHFEARQIKVGGKFACQVSMYKTKTIKVVYISCSQPFIR